ncbi:alcohol dehydrogenase catalytic domain-containing protein [Roseiconus lacunae]|uniref:alcohol dehydrogenase catalytic domain-containing protein n=1 Tax=Roseiconus lacunae TaxID=2605694 RepID=UPI0011F2B49B|nr:alcohol dehydrogenase catalytic domain-containing protein [Roseiconus lacunae]
MRAICFHDIECVAVEEVDDPQIESATDVIVKVEAAGLCGSDLHPYFGRETGLDAGTAMGHEFVGTVIDKGDKVETLQIGDRVCTPFTTSCGRCFYCTHGLSARCADGQLFGWRENGQGLHGGQAERVRVPLADGTLLPIPSWLNNDEALLVGDNLSTAYFGASLAIEANEHPGCVVVIGCGTVGLLAVCFALQQTNTTVIAIDLNEARARQAQALGAIAFSDPDAAAEFTSDQTDGRGADAVLEFVGLPPAQALAFRLIRPGGRMSVIGCHTEPHFAFSPVDAYDKNLHFATGRCPARSLMEPVAESLRRNPMDLSWCITHRFSLEDGVTAYDVFANRKDGCVKAMIELTP